MGMQKCKENQLARDAIFSKMMVFQQVKKFKSVYL